MLPQLRDKPFVVFLTHRFIATAALQIHSVIVAWQVYHLTQNPLYLGYVGLAIFIPTLLMSLPGGRLADILPRRHIMLGALLTLIVCCVLLLIASNLQHPLPLIFGSLILAGVARAMGNPATTAYLPQLIGTEKLVRAMAINSTVYNIGTILGPTAAGLLYAATNGNYPIIYAICTVLLLLAVLCVLALPSLPVPGAGEARNLDLLGGLKFVWKQKMILGVISLDLFAVLLGGATALLPVFAADILHVGATGLGLMRSAPSIGATITALVIAYRPLRARVGRTMLIAVAIFGLATIVFAVSRSFVLSIMCLIVLGAADMISVVIRHTLIQLNTPDAMRGRVSAVSLIFIGASNELGEFESGVTAAWLGTVPAVLIGGIGTCLIVMIWSRLFPQLRKVDRLQLND